MTDVSGSDRRGDVARALAVGVVGSVLLGMREGVATLAGNAFADAQHHAFAYLVVPIAVWFLLAPAVLLPAALVAHALGGASVATYAGLLGAFGTTIALLPTVEEALRHMRATGVEPSAAVRALLWTFTVLLGLAGGGVVRAGVSVAVRDHGVLQRRVVAVAAVVGSCAVLWTTHFLLATFAPPDALAATPVTAATLPPAGAPNVLIVSIDTLRADELGAYGSALGNTPELDRLAAGGVTFTQASSAAPWTLPALASIMTGLYPRHHGAGSVVNAQDPIGRSALVPGIPTIAETFARHGYATHAIVTNPYLLTRSGLGSGFQGYENLTLLSEAMLSGRGDAGQWLLDHLASGLVAGDRGVEVSDHALRWLEQVDGRRPFLLWLHYLDPHGPYGGAGTSRHKTFRGDSTFGAGPADEASLAERSPDPVRLRSGEIRLGPAQKAAVRELYRGEIAEVDRQVGRVLTALAARDLDEQTIVVCVSDHGEEFWDHGGVEHGHSLYDELLRAVLVVRWPGHLPAGRRVDAAVSTVDVAATVRDLAGIDPSPGDGVSLRGVMQGEPARERVLLSENLLFAEDRVAIRSGTAKLIRWDDGKEEAYDLLHDPQERRDLAGVESFVAPLRAELAGLERSMAPRVSPVATSGAPAAGLRALGYLQ